MSHFIVKYSNFNTIFEAFILQLGNNTLNTIWPDFFKITSLT